MTHDLPPPSRETTRRGLGLALVGYRGTGKSTVGKILADRVGRPFFDVDHELQSRVGRSVAAIFATEGEVFFRDWEEETLAELITRHPTAIIATGGGAVLRDANRHRLRSFGFVFWLTANPAELARRIAADPRGLDNRPALTSAGAIAEIDQVLAMRKTFYDEVADSVIETAGKSPEEVAAMILGCWTP